ncbi:hypothetical protein BHS09_18770 [Myxococcus xanthus]|uniref:Uncharacterized protein n=1 Tax=Myxococcus xanthus TaxID=34 RepID=A0AAE6KT47_MYXXA|nr:hypothetical protein BHS09_18770 [Myxococcus xanthus]QDE76135.1 hypothetical protein BHS08_18785 [Myxococcus xanthus]
MLWRSLGCLADDCMQPRRELVGNYSHWSQFSCHEELKDTAQGVKIGPLIDLASALKLLRSGERDRSHGVERPRLPC